MIIKNHSDTDKSAVLASVALYIVPLIMLGLLIFGMVFHAPFWKRKFFDPGYFDYYFNSLNVAIGRPAHFIDHPGTPLIMAGAALLRGIHFIFWGRTEDFITTAITYPEFYLSAIAWVLGTFNILVLWLIGRCVFRETGRLGLGILLQASAFIFYNSVVFVVSINFRPESIVPSLGGIFLLVLACFLYRQEKDKKKYPLYFGAISGILLAIKVSFMPMFLLPLFILPKGQKFRYCFFVLIFFLLSIAPVLYKYNDLFQKACGLLIRNGQWGEGALGTVGVGEVLFNFVNTLNDNIFFVVVYINCFVISLASFFLKETSFGDGELKVLRAIVLVQTIVMLLFVKNLYYDKQVFGFYYYLCPMSLLSVFGLYLSWNQILRMLGPELIRPIYWIGPFVVLIMLVAVVHIKKAMDGQIHSFRIFQIYDHNSRSGRRFLGASIRIENKGWTNYWNWSFLTVLNYYGVNSYWDHKIPERMSQIWGDYYIWDNQKHICLNWSQQISCEQIIQRSRNQGVVFSRKRLSNVDQRKNDFHLPLKEIYHDSDKWVYMFVDKKAKLPLRSQRSLNQNWSPYLVRPPKQGG